MTEGIASNPRLSSGPVPVLYVAAQMVACPSWHGRTMSNSSALPTVRMRLSAPPLNDLDHNHDDRNYQEDMYKSSKRVGGYKAEKPKYDQDDGNCVKHFQFSLLNSNDILLAASSSIRPNKPVLDAAHWCANLSRPS
jgi:hypothetical protein